MGFAIDVYLLHARSDAIRENGGNLARFIAIAKAMFLLRRENEAETSIQETYFQQ